jgi:hypothetical protein
MANRNERLTEIAKEIEVLKQWSIDNFHSDIQLDEREANRFAVETLKAEKSEIESTFKVGDHISYSQGTDTSVGIVVRVTAKSVFVGPVRTKLLNGNNSGAADALHFEPGGFVGHTSGAQRYSYEIVAKTDEHYGEKRFSFRARTGDFKEAGTSINGSMRGWGVLYHGWNKHYDYNF